MDDLPLQLTERETDRQTDRVRKRGGETKSEGRETHGDGERETWEKNASSAVFSPCDQKYYSFATVGSDPD